MTVGAVVNICHDVRANSSQTIDNRVEHSPTFSGDIELAEDVEDIGAQDVVIEESLEPILARSSKTLTGSGCKKNIAAKKSMGLPPQLILCTRRHIS